MAGIPIFPQANLLQSLTPRFPARILRYMNTITTLRIARSYKLGSNTDDGIAASVTDLLECQCCGRKISRIDELTNGLKVGSECSLYLTRPDLRANGVIARANRKADAILATGGWA